MVVWKVYFPLLGYDSRSIYMYVLISFPDPAVKEREGSGTHAMSTFLGTHNAARHVIVMIEHHFGMAMHRPLSCAAIVGFSAVSYCKPHGVNLIGASILILETSPRKAPDVYQTLLLLGVGSEDETMCV